MRRRTTLSALACATAFALGGARAAEPPALYEALCAACHGTSAVPLAGSPYPPLFGNPRLAATGPVYIAIKSLYGAGNMYALCGLANDADIAAIANYLATANGYQGPPLSAEDVAPLRPAAGDCPGGA